MGTGRTGDDPDEEVRRWLAGRLDVEPSHTDAARRTDAARSATFADLRDPSTDETPTSPGLRRNPLRPRIRDEDVDDPATELVDGSLEDDPRTVRVHRMSVAFIGESVLDEATVRAEGWSLPEGPVDEVPLRPRTPTPPPRRPSNIRGFRPHVEPPASAAPEADPAPSVSSMAHGPRPVSEPNPWAPVFGAVLVGGAFGILGAALVLWLAL